jgi:beta-xylosidase
MKIWFIILSVLSIVLFSRCKTNNLPEPACDISEVWVSDNGNGTYKNPVIYSDYSDPDVIRVDDDYFMVSSSFNCTPGIPVLHSKDLVNWSIISHVVIRQKPFDTFNQVQHGKGIWAPSIRYHNNKFYVYYGDPDAGIFMTESDNPIGPWTEPILVEEGKGLIDPCPFWDDNGQAYLVHAWAGSRAGIKSIITLHRMSPDGKVLLDEGTLVFDGHPDNPTVEGPKLYKAMGYYYIFAPAGGVTNGWQLVLRAKNIDGTYEPRIVLHQGNTAVNGPHQGAWVDTKRGENWFIHFQDLAAYGRVVHLQPVSWENGWPKIGTDQNNDGIGEPVSVYTKPNVGKQYAVCTPQSSDEFNSPAIGLQWQWQANPQHAWGFSSAHLGYLRLNALPLSDTTVNYWLVPNLLLQKFTAEKFIAITKVNFYPLNDGDKTGIIVMGADYSYLSVTKHGNDLYLGQAICIDAPDGSKELKYDSVPISQPQFYLKLKVEANALCTFSYSTDSVNFFETGKSFTAKPGRWIGAKVGIFCNGKAKTNDAGYADFDWFRIQ